MNQLFLPSWLARPLRWLFTRLNGVPAGWTPTVGVTLGIPLTVWLVSRAELEQYPDVVVHEGAHQQQWRDRVPRWPLLLRPLAWLVGTVRYWRDYALGCVRARSVWMSAMEVEARRAAGQGD